MSVIINSTTINFDNNTDYLIEIIIEAEQDDSFHVKTSSDVILQNIPKENETFMSTLMSFVYGSKLQKVIINLKSKSEAKLIINSKSCLEVNYSAKIPNSSEHIEGYLPIVSEYQGFELFVKYSVKRGIWYDKNNNVAIVGKTKPHFQDLIINAEVQEKNKKNIFIDEYTPAMCKLSVSSV